jgi:hypothetical protein
MKQDERTIKKNIANALLLRKYPPCFESSRQYKDWLELEAAAPTLPVRQNFCEDCNICYKSQMVREGRCVNPQLILKG